MFGRRWHLFRLLGIPISIDLSWMLIFFILTWFMTENLENNIQGLDSTAYWLGGLFTALVFFVCIVLHELGHAIVARATGTPIRGITLFFFGGVAEMTDEPKSAGREFAMAIAGPVVTAVLIGVFLGLEWLGATQGWHPALVFILGYLGWINLTVLVFNILPGFPLDGGRVFRSALWAAMGNLRRATYWASIVGRVFAWLFITAGLLLFFWGPLNQIEGAVWTGIWFGLIGLFLNNAARSSYQLVLIREALKGEPVSRFMNTQPIVVPPSLDLRHLVEDYVYRYHRKVFPVASNGHLEGFIGVQAVSRVPREEWDHHTVGEVMRQDIRAISVPPDTDALKALARMQRTGSSRLLVTEGDKLVGIVSLKDLLRFLHLKLELEDTEERTSG